MTMFYPGENQVAPSHTGLKLPDIKGKSNFEGLSGLNMLKPTVDKLEHWTLSMTDPRMRRQLVKLLGKTLIFGTTPESFRHMIVDIVQPVEVLTGQVVYRHGDEGDWMGIVLSGRFLRKLPRDGFDVQLGSVGPGEIFGDLGMFGISTHRSFTVESIAAGTILVISQTAFEDAVARARGSVESKSMQMFLDGFGMRNMLADTDSFLELQCFRKLDRAFVLELRENSEARLCYPNQVLMKQGMLGDEMYIIRAGTVRVEKDRKSVVELPSGTVVGELAVLGTDKRRTATIKCKTMCLIRAIHADVFNEIVNKYPRAKRIFEHAYVSRLVSVDVMNTKDEKVWLDNFFGSATPLRRQEAATLIGEKEMMDMLISPNTPRKVAKNLARKSMAPRKSVKLADLYRNLPDEDDENDGLDFDEEENK